MYELLLCKCKYLCVYKMFLHAAKKRRENIFHSPPKCLQYKFLCKRYAIHGKNDEKKYKIARWSSELMLSAMVYQTTEKKTYLNFNIFVSLNRMYVQQRLHRVCKRSFT